jgi:hypothetical protein
MGEAALDGIVINHPNSLSHQVCAQNKRPLAPASRGGEASSNSYRCSVGSSLTRATSKSLTSYVSSRLIKEATNWNVAAIFPLSISRLT